MKSNPWGWGIVACLACACAPAASRGPEVSRATLTSASEPSAPEVAPAVVHAAKKADAPRGQAAIGAPVRPATEEDEAAPREEVAEPAPVRAEPCSAPWVCVRVSAGTRKVTARETLLVGDPEVPSTWSRTTDGRAPLSFDGYTKGAVTFALRRRAGVAEVVAKLPRGGEVVLARTTATVEEMTHVGVIATEAEGGDLLVDVKYMR